VPQCLRCNEYFEDAKGHVLLHNTNTNIVELVDWFHRTERQQRLRVLYSHACGSCGLCNDCLLNTAPEE
jgi:hypothetical protein